MLRLFSFILLMELFDLGKFWKSVDQRQLFR
jgi:hypothetical protein